MKENKMIKVWIIASVLYAVIVHLLFKTPAPKEWMIASWSAGEILTYVSTVSLGLLAVWQNRRFKEENDIAQKRLEAISEKANELSSINKIVEIEYDRLKQVKEAMDDFSISCDPSLIADEYAKKSVLRSVNGYSLLEKEQRINDNFFRVSRLLRLDHTLDGDDKAPIKKAVVDYYNLGRSIVETLKKDSNTLEKIDIDRLKEIRDTFLTQKEHYIKSLEIKLYQVVYGNMSLAEIKKMYNSRKL